MRVHHLNCATFCPPLVRVNSLGKLICHCLLVESSAGLVLVDTGLGLKTLKNPGKYCPPGSPTIMGARLDPEETAVRQLTRLGFDTKDLRHIVLTHLDFDHAGGISDFPDATVHIYEDEYQAAMQRATFFEKQRYCTGQWQHNPKWQRHDLGGPAETFFGFQAVRALPGSDDQILIVPVTGHSRGHSAIAVKTDDGWLLHCGDAYFNIGEMNPEKRTCPPFLDWFQRFAQFDGPSRIRNQERLRQLAKEQRQVKADGVRLFSAHDPEEFAEFSRR